MLAVFFRKLSYSLSTSESDTGPLKCYLVKLCRSVFTYCRRMLKYSRKFNFFQKGYYMNLIWQRYLQLVAVLLSLSLCVSSCGDNGDDDGDSGSPSTSFNTSGFLQNGAGKLEIQMVSTGTTETGSSLNLAGSAELYSLESVVPGAPEDMQLYITAMSLANDETEVPIFSLAEGRPLRITGNSVDLSSFFTEIRCMDADGNVIDTECPCGADADGNPIEQEAFTDPDTGEERMSCPEKPDGYEPPVALMPISQTGTFDTIRVSLLNKASMKGCVEGYVRQDGWSSENPTDKVSQERYCSKSASSMRSSLDGAATSSEFAATSSDKGEWTTTTLSMNPDDIDGTYNVDFAIKEGVTINDLSTDRPKITLVIDNSTMFRFFKRDNYNDKTRPDGGPETEAFQGSYFFTNRLRDQAFVFVGRAGSVRGFEYVADFQRGENGSLTVPSGGAESPTLYACSPPSACRHAKGWLSVIYDADDNPMLFSMQPDDNNTGLKVANNSRDGIDPSALSLSNNEYTFTQSTTDGQGDTVTTNIYKLMLDTTNVGGNFTAYFYDRNERSGGDVIDRFGEMLLIRRL